MRAAKIEVSQTEDARDHFETEGVQVDAARVDLNKPLQGGLAAVDAQGLTRGDGLARQALELCRVADVVDRLAERLVMDRVDVAILGWIDEVETAEVVTGVAEVVPLGGIDGPVVGAVHVGQVEIQAVPAPDEIGILGSEVRRAVGQDRHAERMPGPRLLAAVAAAVVDHVLVEAGVREMPRVGGAVYLEPMVRQLLPDRALGSEDGHRRLVPADAVDGDLPAQDLAEGRQAVLHRLPATRRAGADPAPACVLRHRRSSCTSRSRSAPRP